MSLTILIVDDHGMTREGMRVYLSREPGFEILGEASDGAQAVELARRLRPDVILMDLHMPVMDGIAATEVLRQDLPATRVIIVTSDLEAGLVGRALHAGAAGYILKDADAETLRCAVRTAACGEMAISPAALRLLYDEAGTPGHRAALSEREREVLCLIAQGLSNKEIARCLGIGEKTVKNHVAAILDRLGVASRTQAALAAVRLGLTSPDVQKRTSWSAPRLAA